MGKGIEINLETFGGNRLKTVLAPEEIRGKNVGEVVEMLLRRSWPIEDRRTLEALRTEVNASGGYVPRVGMQVSSDMPVVYQRARLRDSIQTYLPENQQEGKVSISPLGIQEVGY